MWQVTFNKLSTAPASSLRVNTRPFITSWLGDIRQTLSPFRLRCEKCGCWTQHLEGSVASHRGCMSHPHHKLISIRKHSGTGRMSPIEGSKLSSPSAFLFSPRLCFCDGCSLSAGLVDSTRVSMVCPPQPPFPEEAEPSLFPGVWEPLGLWSISLCNTLT